MSSDKILHAWEVPDDKPIPSLKDRLSHKSTPPSKQSNRLSGGGTTQSTSHPTGHHPSEPKISTGTWQNSYGGNNRREGRAGGGGHRRQSNVGASGSGDHQYLRTKEEGERHGNEYYAEKGVDTKPSVFSRLGPRPSDSHQEQPLQSPHHHSRDHHRGYDASTSYSKAEHPANHTQHGDPVAQLATNFNLSVSLTPDNKRIVIAKTSSPASAPPLDSSQPLSIPNDSLNVASNPSTPISPSAAFLQSYFEPKNGHRRTLSNSSYTNAAPNASSPPRSPTRHGKSPSNPRGSSSYNEGSPFSPVGGHGPFSPGGVGGNEMGSSRSPPRGRKELRHYTPPHRRASEEEMKIKPNQKTKGEGEGSYFFAKEEVKGGKVGGLSFIGRASGASGSNHTTKQTGEHGGGLSKDSSYTSSPRSDAPPQHSFKKRSSFVSNVKQGSEKAPPSSASSPATFSQRQPSPSLPTKPPHDKLPDSTEQDIPSSSSPVAPSTPVVEFKKVLEMASMPISWADDFDDDDSFFNI
ncbi:hypothetical protein HDV05_000250 [Chytridiales sp. JEL 0842]|nr:hypothetical protein HDV05_000250 [Chytridiales sp. JEL 0842]